MPDYSEEDLDSLEYSKNYLQEELKPEEFFNIMQKYVNPAAITMKEYPYCALMKIMSKVQCFETLSETDELIFASK